MSQVQPLPATLNDCWNRIGISGDRSCPELVRFIHCRNCPVFASAARAFFDRPPPEGYLAEWTEILGEEQVATRSEGERLSVLLFRLGKEWLALSTGVVVEVTAPRPLHRIPHRTNSILSGLVNIRGQLYLCASLHGLLGVEPSEGPGAQGAHARMVVIRQGHEPWAFTSEEVQGVHRIPRAQLRGVPSTLANPAVNFSQAVFSWHDQSVGYLDEQRVFSGLRSIGS